MPTYRVCGLHVASSLALPGVPEVAGGEVVDVTVHPRTLPPGAAGWTEAVVRPIHVGERTAGGAPVVIADRPAGDETLRLRYAEGMRVHIAPRGDEVWCDWRAPMTDADAVTFLLGPVLGVVLRRKGLVALHASAVVIDGAAALFLGPGGSGKSTLAAACAARGLAVLAEDVVALREREGRWWVQPAYGSIRLWEDSAGMLVADRPLPPLTPTWDKRELDLASAALPMAGAAVPLGEVFVLEDFIEGASTPDCRAIGASELLVELIANVYVNQFATHEELARELAPLRAIASGARGYRLRPGHGGGGLVATAEFVATGARRAFN